MTEAFGMVFWRRERLAGMPVAARLSDLPGAVNLFPAFGISLIS